MKIMIIRQQSFEIKANIKLLELGRFCINIQFWSKALCVNGIILFNFQLLVVMLWSKGVKGCRNGFYA